MPQWRQRGRNSSPRGMTRTPPRSAWRTTRVASYACARQRRLRCIEVSSSAPSASAAREANALAEVGLYRGLAMSEWACDACGGGTSSLKCSPLRVMSGHPDSVAGLVPDRTAHSVGHEWWSGLGARFRPNGIPRRIAEVAAGEPRVPVGPALVDDRARSGEWQRSRSTERGSRWWGSRVRRPHSNATSAPQLSLGKITHRINH